MSKRKAVDVDAVVLYKHTGSFDQKVNEQILKAGARSPHTRDAYLSDWRLWSGFCRDRGVSPAECATARNPAAPLRAADLAVTAWIESMKKNGLAPKTRARRIASMCTIYRRLRRAGVVEVNPFSVEEGPEREPARALEPTPIASPDIVRKVIATCDDSILGKRDGALIRIMWATGARRTSVIDMTFERLRSVRDQYEALLTGKGGKDVRVLIRGQAARALDRWIAVLRDAKLSHGPLWRTKRGPMTPRALGHMLTRRAKAAGIEQKISPHQFRVAFLTINPAGIEAKQSAAGHADPATTMLYDRASWRGKEAFESMPEIEDADE